MQKNTGIALLAAFVLLAAAAVVLKDATGGPKYRDVGNSPGGYIPTFFLEIQNSVMLKERVRIVGRCDSACTLWLAHPDVCVHKYASLGFHQARMGRKPTDPPAPEATAFMLSQYPPAIREWIAAQGGLGDKLIRLRGKELFKRVRRCK